MNIYSDITIENLDGFKCYIKGITYGEFEIKNGIYLDIDRGLDNRIGYISTGENGLLIYNYEGEIITILSAGIDDDNKVLKDMLSYCIYNKRKEVLKSLNI